MSPLWARFGHDSSPFCIRSRFGMRYLIARYHDNYERLFQFSLFGTRVAPKGNPMALKLSPNCARIEPYFVALRSRSATICQKCFINYMILGKKGHLYGTSNWFWPVLGSNWDPYGIPWAFARVLSTCFAYVAFRSRSAAICSKICHKLHVCL